jgi:hypothetical protein
MATTIPRAAYAATFGPTTGDRLRLADTERIIEIESDRTIYGEEVKFGAGKVIRDGMGQRAGDPSRRCRRRRHHQCRDPRSLGHRQGRYRHFDDQIRFPRDNLLICHDTVLRCALISTIVKALEIAIGLLRLVPLTGDRGSNPSPSTGESVCGPET